jgi:hypothetical protein
MAAAEGHSGAGVQDAGSQATHEGCVQRRYQPEPFKGEAMGAKQDPIAS